VIHAPLKEEGNLPGLSILVEIRIAGPQWRPTAVMHMTLNERTYKMNAIPRRSGIQINYSYILLFINLEDEILHF
jgi:hypothetical protein